MSTTPVKFDIYSGQQLVRTEILTGPVIKVGKVTSSTLRLDDDSVSRMHAQIELNSPDDVILLDLGSERGTSVNGQTVMRTRLSTGDVINFGDVQVVITIVGQSVTQAVAPEARPQVSAPTISFDDIDAGYGYLIEVLALYGNAVIDVSYLNDEGAYYIGYSEDADCFIPEGHVPAEPFPLAVMTPDGAMMVHIPNHIMGEVMLDGTIYNIQDLRDQNQLQRSQVPNTTTLKLPNKARCRLRFGDFTFLVNAVPRVQPPATLSPLGFFDTFFMAEVGGVAAFMALVLMLISLIPEAPDSLAFDRLANLEKFVTITLDAEEMIEKKEKKEGGDKGAKRAKDAEGKMGKKEVLDQNKKFQIKGAETGDPSVIRARKQELAQNTVNEIFSSFDSGLLDGTESAVALGALEGFVGNQTGATAGAAFGVGGLGGVGTGMGGGGDSATSFGLGGLSTVGGGGGRGGRGNGYGSGVGNVGGNRRARKPKMIAMSIVDDSGNLPKSVIRRVILSRKGAYQNCYERQLQNKRDLNGKISINVKVSGSTGKVIVARVVGTTMNNPSVEQCILGHIKKLRFPTPKNGKTVIFTYPFRFKPS
jgi:hypothetical protein